MGRRKLTKQQKARTHKEVESHWDKGQIIARYGKKVELRFDQQTVRLLIPGKFQGATPVEDLAVGDWVYFDATTKMIETLVPRDSALIRVRRHTNAAIKHAIKNNPINSFGKVVAANVTQLCIVVAPKPFIERMIIDEYLLAAQMQGINACIVANKNDLAEADEPGYQHYLNEYESLGIQVLRVSAQTALGKKQLESVLEDHTSVFMGTSGAGKSSLLNMILDEEIAVTGEISEAAALGKHTTTTAKLYALESGGNIIDSPGIREFKVGAASPQDLFQAYQELYAGDRCQYNNCTHRDEPNCAVKKAVEQGRAFQWRYDNYLNLYHYFVEGGS